MEDFLINSIFGGNRVIRSGAFTFYASSTNPVMSFIPDILTR